MALADAPLLFIGSRSTLVKSATLNLCSTQKPEFATKNPVLLLKNAKIREQS